MQYFMYIPIRKKLDIQLIFSPIRQKKRETKENYNLSKMTFVFILVFLSFDQRFL